MLTTSSELDRILPALLKVKRGLPAIERDVQCPDRLNRHASLDGILRVIHPMLYRARILCLHSPVIRDGLYGTQTRLVHVSTGQWVEAVQVFLLQEPQAVDVLKIQSMARRFNLLLLLDLECTDGSDQDGGSTLAHRLHVAQAEAETHVKGQTLPGCEDPPVTPATPPHTPDPAIVPASVAPSEAGRPAMRVHAPAPLAARIATAVEALRCRDRLENFRRAFGNEDRERIFTACFPRGLSFATIDDLARAETMMEEAVARRQAV